MFSCIHTKGISVWTTLEQTGKWVSCIEKYHFALAILLKPSKVEPLLPVVLQLPRETN